MVKNVLHLPSYPSTQTRKNLSASQLASLNQTIASTLGTVIALPPEKRDTPSAHKYLATYAKDTAFQSLQHLIWRDSSSENASKDRSSSDERLIHKRSLLLAQKLVLTSPGLDLQTLLDLSIVYARTQPTHLRPVFVAAFKLDPGISRTIASDLVPGFSLLLSQQTPTSQGLYAQRKVAECIYAFLCAAKGTPDLIRPFAHNKQFVIALASLYDVGMTAVAVSYGGIPALTAGISGQDRGADEWENIWVETKVALLDSFHIMLTTLLDDLASAPAGPRLAEEAERAFDIIFALLEVPSSSSTSTSTPFLNQSLLVDYQQSYELSKTLAKALNHAQEKDVRLDLLESSLQSLENSPDSNDTPKSRNAGALKILLRSSGIQPGIDNLGVKQYKPQDPLYAVTSNKGKGKSRAAPPPPALSDPDLDILATQVLDILPDTPASYVKLLLAHDRYGRNPEKVIEALLEGTAMSEELERDLYGVEEGMDSGQSHEAQVNANEYDITKRKNVFDDELDVSMLRVGKKTTTGDEVLKDRTFIEQMKADILRRAEAITDDEEEDEYDPFGEESTSKGKGKARQADFGPDEDEDDSVVNLRVAGDGEGSDESDEGEEEEEEEVQTPETMLELAYIRDPKVFERDAVTRRSKARVDLKAQTGWADEQIEGWKLMLDRTPRLKEKMMEKHAFTGNQKGMQVHAGDGGNRGRGRGNPRGGRGRGGGRGGGGGAGGGAAGGGGPGGEGSARERAWKDKNKASRGNHNRKRGHDKKMARAGAGPST